ncbi:PepSY-associated TM helix [compost metagenome]
MTEIASGASPTKVKPMMGLYRTIWRWHFYAGLVTAPFMLILAVTGAIYLFNDEITDAFYPQQRFVAVAPDLPVSRLIGAALADYPGGSATRIDMPVEPGRSAVVFVTPAKGDPERVYVDPGTAQVLGRFIYTRTLVGFADVFHGSLMLGDRGDAVVELMACWGLILVVTGLYLWWPRNGRGLIGVVLPRFPARGRMFWRDLHAVTGVWTALLIAFLILTGLPWATVWGGLLKQGTDALGIGYPANHRLHGATPATPSAAPPRTMIQTMGEAPWTLEDKPVPVSDPHAEHRGGGAGMTMAAASHGIDVDGAVAALHRSGMTSAYRLSLPKGPDGVYTAYTYPARPEGQRTLHVDQYSGRILGDVKYADYGWAAKGVELGVQLHMGNYFGSANQILMLIACMGVILLSITGPIMWWKRRPKGRLGAPRELAPLKMRTMALITLGLGLIFPLAGASLALLLILDKSVQSLWTWASRV